MLLLPLILWWADAPMRFADGRLRLAVSIVVIALIVSPRGNPATRVFADDRFGRDHNRSELARGGDANNAQSNKAFKQLREGTLIPPTVGKIVMLGRRWAFVPATAKPKNDHDLARSEQRFRSSMVGFNDKPRPTLLGAGSTAANGSRASHRATLVGDHANVERSPDEDVPYMMIAENLMLQRIVEAIRADTSDDRWTVSGEVTEFFNENRLMIRTAQRANLN